MIPHVIHFIWLGPKPLPAQAVRNMLRFQQLNPLANVWFWDDVTQAALKVPERQLIEAETNFGAKSDILRLVLLREFGGVYCDVDLRPQQPIWSAAGEPLWWQPDSELVMVQMTHPEGWRRFGNSFMAAAPRQAAVCRMLDLLPGYWLRGQTLEVPERTGPGFVDAVIQPWLAAGGRLVELPEPALYPYGWWETDPAVTKRTYPDALAVHECWRTWC